MEEFVEKVFEQISFISSEEININEIKEQFLAALGSEPQKIVDYFSGVVGSLEQEAKRLAKELMSKIGVS